jgi:DNA polymerase family A
MTKIGIRQAWAQAPIKDLSFSEIEENVEAQKTKLFQDFDAMCEHKHLMPKRDELPYHQIKEGWNTYNFETGKIEICKVPRGILQIFDCETVENQEKHRSPFCASTFVLHHNLSFGLYFWLSDGDTPLIPCEIELTIEVSCYDATYLENSYKLHGKARYLDVLSLANSQYKFTDDQVKALRGMSQYGASLPWADLGCYVDAGDGKGKSEFISLARLVKFFFNESHSKEVRSDIVKATWDEAMGEKRIEFLSYNYSDIVATFRCFYLLYKRCKNTIPSAFTWIGMLEESKTLYRLEDDFFLWLDKCDKQYDLIKRDVIAKLKSIGISYARSAPFEDFDDGLDWSVKERKTYNFECFFQEGAPEVWYDMYKSGQYKYCEKWVKLANDSKYIIGWLLDSHLLLSVELYFVFKLRCSLPRPVWLVDWLKKLDKGDGITSLPTYLVCKAHFQDDRLYQERIDVNGRDLNRLCVSMAPLLDPNTNEEKGAVGLFGSGYDLWYNLKLLTSPSRDLEHIRELYGSLNHWGKLRDRLHNLRIYNRDGALWLKPDVSIHGAVSGRQSSKLWHLMPKITKHNRSIGIEYAQKVVSPKDHYTIAADFDSQELRGQALISDLTSGFIASNDFSSAVYIGNKEAGTDPHSIMAKKQGIKRDSAKNLIYGAGYLGGVDRLAGLVYSNLDSSVFVGSTLGGVLDGLKAQAKSFLLDYRGRKQGDLYVGGLASSYYNKTIELANRPNPKSLVLGVQHSKHLDSTYCGKDFLTTRVNINVQRMGVDFMHLYLCVVRVLADYLEVLMHLNMCIHDNFLFYVLQAQASIAEQIMQTAHLFTWCFALKAMGFKEIPQEIMFFEGVDLDTRYRKYPSDPCVTLSNSGFPAFQRVA